MNDSIAALWLPRAATAGLGHKKSEIEREVIALFDEFRNPQFRYCLSLGISIHYAEEVIQEVFLNLYRHLQAERSRENLRGWIFRVAHNQALKQRLSQKRTLDRLEYSETFAEDHSDIAPSPEEYYSMSQRRNRLLAAVDALAELDRNCLWLRAEGLRYREIAEVLGISLGLVARSLARTWARLAEVDGE